MDNININSDDLNKIGADSRVKTGGDVPFVLRAWWMREFQEYEDMIWPPQSSTTAPLWSYYSDPLCDVAGLDSVYNL